MEEGRERKGREKGRTAGASISKSELMAHSKGGNGEANYTQTKAA